MDSKMLNLLSKRAAGLINQLNSNDFTKLSELAYDGFMNRIRGNQPFAFTPDITLSFNGVGVVVDGDHDGGGGELQAKGESSTRSVKILLDLFGVVSKSNIKPSTLKNQLCEAGWHEDKIDAFINFWSERQSKTIETLKNKSFDYSSNTLKNVQRSVKILSDHSCESQPKLPLAQINLEFNNDFDCDQVPQHLTLNFDHQALTKFYDQLETIQNKIDKLYYNK